MGGYWVESSAAAMEIAGDAANMLRKGHSNGSHFQGTQRPFLGSDKEEDNLGSNLLIPIFSLLMLNFVFHAMFVVFKKTC